MAEELECRNCGKSFGTKPDLMVHRKIDHYNTVAPCRKNLDCEFSADKCRWKHSQEDEINLIECYFCEATFEPRLKKGLLRKKRVIW